MDEEIISGVPMCMEHNCVNICLDGVEFFCPECKAEEVKGE